MRTYFKEEKSMAVPNETEKLRPTNSPVDALKTKLDRRPVVRVTKSKVENIPTFIYQTCVTRPPKHIRRLFRCSLIFAKIHFGV